MTEEPELFVYVTDCDPVPMVGIETYVTVAGKAVIFVPAACPVPVRLMLLCVPLVALATKVPLRAPATVGVNFTVPVHVALAAIVDGQDVGMKLKSPVVLALKPRACPPLTVIETAWPALVVFNVWPENVNEVGAKPNVARVPVPEMLMVCGLPVPLEVSVTVPERAPTAVGVNAIVTVQVAPDASDVLQVLPLMVKSLVLIWIEIPVTVALFPVTVIGIVAAAFKTTTLLKFTDVGLKLKNAWLGSGTERSQTPRPWVTARSVRVVRCSFKPNTGTLGSVFSCNEVHVGVLTLQLVLLYTPTSVAA